MVKSPRPWTNAPSIYKHMQTRLHSFLCVVLPCTRTNSDDFHKSLQPSPSDSLPTFHLKTLVPSAEFLCSHIVVTAFPWQVKQFTNTREQICRKRRTRIFWWSKGKKKKSMQKYRLLHRQFNTEWVVLADNWKDKKIKRNEDDMTQEDKLCFVFYFSINTFLSAAYSQAVSTDTCKNSKF